MLEAVENCPLSDRYTFLGDHGQEDSRFAIPLAVAIQLGCEEVPVIPMSPMTGTRLREEPRRPLLTNTTGGSTRRTRVKRVTLPRVKISNSDDEES